MKLAVLADIHSNLPALQAVLDHIDAWRPDAVVVAGDVVNRGPRPVECLELVMQRVQREGWLLVRGNHEDYVLTHVVPDPSLRPIEREVYQNSYWTYVALGVQVAGGLADWPLAVSLQAPDGSEVRVTHASMRGNRDGIFPWTTDEVLREQMGHPPALLFCVGHTHRPLARTLDGRLIVNVGAAGLPFDGDPRASYGQFTWRHGDGQGGGGRQSTGRQGADQQGAGQHGGWQAEIVRLDYDRTVAEADFAASGFLDEGGPLSLLILEELRHARSYIGEWVNAYWDAVMAGEVSIEESVRRFLAEVG